MAEYEPAVRTVLFGSRMYRLQFPYQYFVVRTNRDRPWHGVRLHAYWRSRPVTSDDDNLYATCLPNISEAGKVCLFVNREADDWTTFQNAVAEFWSSSFNFSGQHRNADKRFFKLGLSRLRPRYRGRESLFEAWEDCTRRNAFCWKFRKPITRVRDVERTARLGYPLLPAR